MAISPTTASTLPALLISTAPLRPMAALWAAVNPPRLSSPSPPGSVQQRPGCAEQHLKGGGCCCFGTMAAPLHPCLCGAGRPLHPFSCLATWVATASALVHRLHICAIPSIVAASHAPRQCCGCSYHLATTCSFANVSAMATTPALRPLPCSCSAARGASTRKWADVV